jgi:6,7-dimethyl-8-ribityllumazine synthase
LSERYETPRWDDDDEVPVLGEGEGTSGEDALPDDAEPAPRPDALTPQELEDPWQRAARETRETREPERSPTDGGSHDGPDHERDDDDVDEMDEIGGDELDRSSENVLSEWPSSTGRESLPPEAEHAYRVDDRPAAPSGWTAAPAREPAPELEADEAIDPEPPPEPWPASALVETEQVEAEQVEPEAPADEPAAEDSEPVVEQLDASSTIEHAAGSLLIPPGVPALEGVPRGERRAVGIVVSRFNGDITTKLLDGALAELADRGVATEVITVMPVPGAFELPLAAMALAKTRRFSCIVALGCVIRGDTPHFEYVCSEAASGLQLAAIETGVPVAFGVLTLDSRDQADARIGKGAEAVRTALEMADIFANLRAAAAR